MVKRHLPSAYVTLATNVEESSDMLFGDSICERLEAIKKENQWHDGVDINQAITIQST